MIINAATLKEILDHVPDDFEVEFLSDENILIPVSDKVEVDVSGKKIILKP